MGLDYVDIFYSHRFDPETPLEETMGALDQPRPPGQGAVRRHQLVLPRRTRRPRRSCATRYARLIHQPSYSMLNRWIEGDLLDTLEDEGIGCIAFSPLAQGMLSDKYLDGIPERPRARHGGIFSEGLLTDSNLAKVDGLNRSQAAGPKPRQMAIAWTLRDPLGAAPRR